MTYNPERAVGGVVAGVVACVYLGRALQQAWKTPASPDPWDKETDDALHEPEAREVCHRCFDPVEPGTWFCGHCGCAVGPYNNVMPYLQVFSEGEVLRNGTNDNLGRNPLIVAGYLLYFLGTYFVFAPIYWIFFFRNLKRQSEPRE